MENIRLYTNFDLSIRHWRIFDIKTEIAIAQELLLNAKTISDQHGYVRLFRKDNKALFTQLTKLSMFDFHSTNNGTSLGMHQIVLYLAKGWKFYRRGKFAECGSVEVHHLDHDPTNNQVANLWYVTPVENKLLAQGLVGGFCLNKSYACDPRRLIRNSVRFIKLQITTAWRTLSRLGLESFIWFSL